MYFFNKIKGVTVLYLEIIQYRDLYSTFMAMFSYTYYDSYFQAYIMNELFSFLHAEYYISHLS